MDPIAGNTPTHEYSSTTDIQVIPPSVVFPNARCTLHKPLYANGGYENINTNYKAAGLSDFLKWKFGKNDHIPKKPEFPTPEEARVKLPSVEVDKHAMHRFSPYGCTCADCGASTHSDSSIVATWTGHASFIVTMNDFTILTDPVWSERASPVQCAGPKRMVPPPIELDRLPYIDVVTISHNHYDHLDTMTVKHLIRSNHKLAATVAGETTEETHPIFVVPLGMKARWFASIASSVPELKMDHVVELMWWDTADLSSALAANRTKIRGRSTDATLTITAVPVQHWSARNGFDRKKELWCGFVYKSSKGDINHTAFHAGDTGYFEPIFQQIGEVCGPIDFSMIPIGAYEPRHIMNAQHVSPFEAALIHRDVRSLHSAGMHWGTFMLTVEPIDEPPKALAAAMASVGDMTATSGDAFASTLRNLRTAGFPQQPVESETPFRALRCGESWAIPLDRAVY